MLNFNPKITYHPSLVAAARQVKRETQIAQKKGRAFTPVVPDKVWGGVRMARGS